MADDRSAWHEGTHDALRAVLTHAAGTATDEPRTVLGTRGAGWREDARAERDRERARERDDPAAAAEDMVGQNSESPDTDANAQQNTSDADRGPTASG